MNRVDSTIWTYRPADENDREILRDLLTNARWTHQHLDWVYPLDLLGEYPFLFAIYGRKPCGCLACPPDPPTVAWLRLFSVSGERKPKDVWDFLWPLILEQTRSTGATFAAALLTVDWLPPLLKASGFEHTNDVIFLEWEETSPPPMPPHMGTLRVMKPEDIPVLASVDQRAFDSVWAYSAHLIRTAFEQAALATVIEFEGVPVAYQITTVSWHGAHIARLAVDPNWQGQGMGKALVADAIQKHTQQRSMRVTVNTQVDNTRSLHLYRSLGFQPDGSLHPFYELDIHAT